MTPLESGEVISWPKRSQFSKLIQHHIIQPAKQCQSGNQRRPNGEVVNFRIFAEKKRVLVKVGQDGVLLCCQVGDSLGPISGEENVDTLISEDWGNIMIRKLVTSYSYKLATWNPPSLNSPLGLEDLQDCSCSRWLPQDQLPGRLTDRRSSTPPWW